MAGLEKEKNNEELGLNLFSAMRSFYRYLKLIDLSAPDFLLELELKLLRSRIIELSDKELDQLVLKWQDFYDKQRVQDELEDIELDKDLDNFFQSLN
jgi:hypothetical protein